MVTNQDGLGTRELPAGRVRRRRTSSCSILQLAGHRVRRSLHLPAPSRGQLRLPQAEDRRWSTTTCASAASTATRSAMIGDRDTDIEFAQQPRRARLAGAPARHAGRPWPAIVRDAHRAPRTHRAQDARRPTSRRRRPRRDRAASQIAPASASSITCSSSSRKHGGFALELNCRATCTSTSTTPSRTARSRSAQALRKALGDKRGIGALRLPAADGRSAGAGGDRSVRPAVLSCSRASSRAKRSAGCRPSSCRTSSARWPRALGRRDPHQRARREHAPHGRGLLQGRRPRAAPGVPPRRRRTAEHEGRAVKRDVVDHRQRRRQPRVAARSRSTRLGAEPRVTSDPARIRRAAT